MTLTNIEAQRDIVSHDLERAADPGTNYSSPYTITLLYVLNYAAALEFERCEQEVRAITATAKLTYTAEDIKGAFEAGENRNDYEAGRFDPFLFAPVLFAPDFAQFMDGLNTSKSMP